MVPSPRILLLLASTGLGCLVIQSEAAFLAIPRRSQPRAADLVVSAAACFSSSLTRLGGSTVLHGTSSAREATPLSSLDASSNDRRPRICILGGGFGGLNAALALAHLPWPTNDLGPKPTITLVDEKERFVFLPLLYELCVDAASLEEVAPTYRSLLDGTDVSLVRGRVDGIDVDRNVVHVVDVSDGDGDGNGNGNGNGDPKRRSTISYDALIVATGARMDLGSTSGADTFALPFYTVDQCYELRRRLNVLDAVVAAERGLGGSDDDGDGRVGGKKKKKKKAKARVVVVGGGYSGVELALNILERLGGEEACDVTLVHRGAEVLQYGTEYNRKTGQDRLKRAGVQVLTDTTVVEVLPPPNGMEAGDIKSDDPTGHSGSSGRVVGECIVKICDRDATNESSLHADLLLWTAGATSSNVPEGILNSILPRDSKGRIVTGRYLRVKGHDNVFALGDCSRAKKVPYAATAQVAMQQAPVVAWNVHASLRNRIVRDEKRSASMSFSIGEESKLKLVPFNYVDLGEMLTFGNDDASISSLGGLIRLSGPGASVLRRLVYAVRMPTVRQGATALVESARRRVQGASTRGKVGERKRKGKPIQWR